MTEVFIVEAFRQYGDSWIEDVFDSQEKATAFCKERTDGELMTDDDLMFMISKRDVK